MLSNPVLLYLTSTLSSALVYATDQVVVIKASDGVDVQALKLIEGTAVVYKVKRLNFYKNPAYEGKYNLQGKYWNYLVLGKGFASNEEKEAFVAKISSYYFVEAYSGIGLKTNPFFNHADLNKIMANVPQENLIKRPMKAASKSKCNQIVVDGFGTDGKALVINFAKYGDDSAVKKYMGNLVLRVFSALKVQFIYTSAEEDGVFDTFTILDYRNKDTWCEYVLSKFVKINVPQFKKAYKAVLELSAVEV